MTTEQMVFKALSRFMDIENVSLYDELTIFKSKLDFLEFLCYLEEIANLKIDPDDAENFKTLYDVNAYILQRMI